MKKDELALKKIKENMTKQLANITSLKTTAKDKIMIMNNLNSQITKLSNKNKEELEKNNAEALKDTEQDKEIATLKADLRKQKEKAKGDFWYITTPADYYDAVQDKNFKKKKMKISRTKKDE